MANLSFSGIDGLMLSMQEAAEIPDDVAEAMLQAEAEIVEQAQIAYGMQMGVYRTGETLASIRPGKMKRGRNGGRLIYVTPQGVNDREERNAAVAFINEYGKRNQAPRPFIATANEAAATPAVEAAANIYDAFVQSKGL